ncbi:MAG: LysR family transcriptional regulator [Pseudomonadota bacterium]
MSLNYHHLRLFRAVAHEGNLTRAADRLALSQSALSVQIKRLEEALGNDLFDRQGRRLVLTEAGRIALDHADAIFATGDTLLETLRGSHDERRQIRVGALATLSRNFQIRFLAPLIHRNDVEVVLRSGHLDELLDGLQALNLDVVIANQPPTIATGVPIVAQRVAELGVSLFGAPRVAEGGPDAQQLLATHPLLLPSSASGIRTGLDAWLARRGLRPQIAAEVDDMAMLRLLAREGVGLAALPPIVVEDELAQGLLVELAKLPQIVETFYALTIERRFPNPLVGALLDGSSATQ